MTIRTRSYARAGLIGNPSDGYYGKCISFIVKNFYADVTLNESPELIICPYQQDHFVYESLERLDRDIRNFGYYRGMRLVKGALRRFYRYCQSRQIEIPRKNCTLEYKSTIPMQVGLAGSSAIVTACIKALMKFYNVEIPLNQLPNIVLSVETEELGIPAGLQDRVVQAYEGCVFMDFSREVMESQGHGCYESLDVTQLPPLFIAYHTRLSEGTEVFHNDIRGRWRRGDPEVLDAMTYFADLAQEGRELIVNGRGHDIGPLLDKNFEKRASLYRISSMNRELIDCARLLGCPAKFAGSGGAVVGMFDSDETFDKLKQAYAEIGAEIVVPQIL